MWRRIRRRLGVAIDRSLTCAGAFTGALAGSSADTAALLTRLRGHGHRTSIVGALHLWTLPLHDHHRGELLLVRANGRDVGRRRHRFGNGQRHTDAERQ